MIIIRDKILWTQMPISALNVSAHTECAIVSIIVPCSRNEVTVFRAFILLSGMQTERKKRVVNWFNLLSPLNGCWVFRSIVELRKNGRGITGLPVTEVGAVETYNSPAKRLVRLSYCSFS